ncbi:Uncharacterized protein Fot_18523 [Forsythia ovata]|uniref:Uncharacterized protein n=1 Tax=Forsythia ovata TaxID=205694 RepID=A0ABD1VIE7_9LAMI
MRDSTTESGDGGCPRATCEETADYTSDYVELGLLYHNSTVVLPPGNFFSRMLGTLNATNYLSNSDEGCVHWDCVSLLVFEKLGFFDVDKRRPTKSNIHNTLWRDHAHMGLEMSPDKGYIYTSYTRLQKNSTMLR